MRSNCLESTAVRDIGLRFPLKDRGGLALGMSTMLTDFKRAGNKPSRMEVLKY